MMHGENTRAAPRVLLVEDHPANVLVATTLLAGFGYEHEVATSGEMALQKLQDSHFDVVLMDVQMQGMDGFEATRRLRHLETSKGRRRAAVIAMTAHALSGDRDRCLAAGMDDYLSKPFTPHELRDKLDELTQQLAA